MIKFYNELPEMMFFVGDTLPIFKIIVKNQDIKNCTMYMVVSKVKSPKETMFTKQCNNYGDYFAVHFWSEDTKNLTPGIYRLTFIMADDKTPALTYAKLSGLIHVRSLSEG